MKYNEILNIIPGEICVIRDEHGVTRKFVKRQPSRFRKVLNSLTGNKKVVVYERA